MKIILIEDEKRMAQALGEILRQEKYEVDHFSNSSDGLEAIRSNIYDVIILDVMLPGINGYEIAKTARREEIKTPILMLTAKSELDDKVIGLDSGADDYLTKPFMTKELLARLRALIRRSLNVSEGVISFGDISLNVNTFILSNINNWKNVKLSDKEFRILEYLIANSKRILTREQLAIKIWGYENDSEYNNVEVYMSFIRKKLIYIGSLTEIKAIRGVGYELRCTNV